MGLGVLDEYFGLLLAEDGFALTTIPLVLAAMTLAEAVGGLIAPRASGWSSRRIAVLLALAATAIGLGALAAHPLGIVGIAIGYGVISMSILVADVRQQQVTPSRVRATVTSVTGAVSESVAVFGYALFALLAGGLGYGPVMALVAALLLVCCPLLARGIPPVRPENC